MLMIVFLNFIIVFLTIFVYSLARKILSKYGLSQDPANLITSMIITLFITEIVSASIFHLG